jgi:hypothetical protein
MFLLKFLETPLIDRIRKRIKRNYLSNKPDKSFDDDLKTIGEDFKKIIPYDD